MAKKQTVPDFTPVEKLDAEIAKLDEQIAALVHRQEAIPELIADNWGKDTSALEQEASANAPKLQAAKVRRAKLIRQRQQQYAQCIAEEVRRLSQVSVEATEAANYAAEKLFELQRVIIPQQHDAVDQAKAKAGAARNALHEFFTEHVPHLHAEDMQSLLALHAEITDPGTSAHVDSLTRIVEDELKARRAAAQ